MDASVVIRFKGPMQHDAEVRVIDHGQEPSEEEAKWIAYQAVPHLERYVFGTDEQKMAYHMEIARPLIEKKLRA
jgi:hypothetical protein